ncbi:hypothetical protein BVC80_1709g6 [Macleaya cordata]|uniref:Uncharacterized protein n=1 Tax=Macleaya cordata TaxID=56857 RepID=A0A200Q6K5_MACCD|nr:hypothetical protein BVC80_1709g6 [Macleaya cordata]
MATHQLHIFLLLLISILTTIIAPSIKPHIPIKPNKPSDQHLQNISEALKCKGNFSNWAVVFSATDPSTFPLTATLFGRVFGNPPWNAIANL